MKIALTGAAGFIGSHCLNVLAQTGHEVVAQYRTIKGTDFGKVTWRMLDITDPGPDPYGALGRPDILIHLAWDDLEDFSSERHLSIHLPAHTVFLRTMIQAGLRKLVVTGTCLEYGLREGICSEIMTPEPVVAYAQAKNSLRLALELIAQNRDIPLLWLRIFYLYGSGQNPKALLPQLQQALDNHETVFKMSGGEQRRDYLPVEKVANYIVRTALQDRVSGIVNICSGTPIMVRDLVNGFLHEHGQRIDLDLGYYPYPDYEPMAFWGSRDKLNRILNNG